MRFFFGVKCAEVVATAISYDLGSKSWFLAALVLGHSFEAMGIIAIEAPVLRVLRPRSGPKIIPAHICAVAVLVVDLGRRLHSCLHLPRNSVCEETLAI